MMKLIDCFDRALEINPNDSWTWSNKGGCHSNLGQYDIAIDCFKKAGELIP